VSGALLIVADMVIGVSLYTFFIIFGTTVTLYLVLVSITYCFPSI